VWTGEILRDLLYDLFETAVLTLFDVLQRDFLFVSLECHQVVAVLGQFQDVEFCGGALDVDLVAKIRQILTEFHKLRIHSNLVAEQRIESIVPLDEESVLKSSDSVFTFLFRLCHCKH